MSRHMGVMIHLPFDHRVYISDLLYILCRVPQTFSAELHLHLFQFCSMESSFYSMSCDPWFYLLALCILLDFIVPLILILT